MLPAIRAERGKIMLLEETLRESIAGIAKTMFAKLNVHDLERIDITVFAGGSGHGYFIRTGQPDSATWFNVVQGVSVTGEHALEIKP